MSTPAIVQDEQHQRLEVKLRRELGDTVLRLLEDNLTEDIILNPDGWLWVKRMGHGFARIGEMPSAQAARALVDRAAALVDEALQASRPTRNQTIGALIAVDEAKSLAYAFGPAVTGDLLSFDGAPEVRQGLDRFWRNSRTHSLHDPIRWRQFYVGNYHLNGALAPDLASRFEGLEHNGSSARGAGL